MRRGRSIAICALALTLLMHLAAAAGGPADNAGWMGVMIDGAVVIDDDGDDAGRTGVRLGRIFEDSPAARAGLRARDIVLDVDGRPVATGRELALTIREHGTRAWVPLTVWRNGEQRDVRIRLGQRPDDTSAQRLRRGHVGLAVIDLPAELREHFGATREAGVMIARIAAGSPAEAAGLELGDVLFEIDGTALRGPGAVQQMIQGAGVGNTIEIRLMRDGVEIVAEALVARDPAAGAPTR